MPQSTNLYKRVLGLDSTWKYVSNSNCSMAECFPKKLSRCRNEHVCQGVKCSALSGQTDWIPHYIRTYLYLCLCRQMLWFAKELVKSGVTGAESVMHSLLRQIAGQFYPLSVQTPRNPRMSLNSVLLLI